MMENSVQSCFVWFGMLWWCCKGANEHPLPGQGCSSVLGPEWAQLCIPRDSGTAFPRLCTMADPSQECSTQQAHTYCIWKQVLPPRVGDFKARSLNPGLVSNKAELCAAGFTTETNSAVTLAEFSARTQE